MKKLIMYNESFYTPVCHYQLQRLDIPEKNKLDKLDNNIKINHTVSTKNLRRQKTCEDFSLGWQDMKPKHF
jgi:hypothetical protein